MSRPFPPLWPQTLRGFILGLFGFAFMALGWVQFIRTTIPEPQRTYQRAALEHAPPLLYGCVFVGVGFFCAVAGYLRRGDKIGYVVAAMLAAAWSGVYIASVLAYDAPLRALGGAVVWTLLAAILTACSRIPDVRFDGL